VRAGDAGESMFFVNTGLVAAFVGGREVCGRGDLGRRTVSVTVMRLLSQNNCYDLSPPQRCRFSMGGLLLFCEEGRAISSDCDFATVRCGLRLTHRVAATAAAQVELIRRGHYFGEIAFIAQARAGFGVSAASASTLSLPLL
jgi:CRP-like cAMP-binding protein